MSAILNQATAMQPHQCSDKNGSQVTKRKGNQKCSNILETSLKKCTRNICDRIRQNCACFGTKFERYFQKKSTRGEENNNKSSISTGAEEVESERRGGGLT